MNEMNEWNGTQQEANTDGNILELVTWTCKLETWYEVNVGLDTNENLKLQKKDDLSSEGITCLDTSVLKKLE